MGSAAHEQRPRRRSEQSVDHSRRASRSLGQREVNIVGEGAAPHRTREQQVRCASLQLQHANQPSALTSSARTGLSAPEKPLGPPSWGLRPHSATPLRRPRAMRHFTPLLPSTLRRPHLAQGAPYPRSAGEHGATGATTGTLAAAAAQSVTCSERGKGLCSISIAGGAVARRHAAAAARARRQQPRRQQC